MTPTEARVQKIVGEIAEARKQEAAELVCRFNESYQISVAEILADAHKGERFDDAKTRLGVLSRRDRVTTHDFVDLYLSLGLQPSGAERS